MRDRKNSLIILIILFAIIAGIIVKFSGTDKISHIDRDIISNLEKERDEYLEEINRLQNQLYFYEKEEIKDDPELREINRDIENFKIASGYTDVYGKGIIINIEDTNNSNSKIIDDIGSLLKIISVLNSAGAEAISINGERYNSFTEIERASEHLIINGRITNTPLEIKAIGDPDILESALTIKGGLVDYYKEILGSNINLEQKDEIKIDRNWDMKDFNFIEIE